MEKVADLSEVKPLVIENMKVEEKEVEMELAPPEAFEGFKAYEVTSDDLEQLYSLAQEMVKFAHARGGVGLTLPQIGISKRAFVMLDKDDQWVMMINPEFFGTGKKVNVYERSLSYSGVYSVLRYKKINAAYYTLDVDRDDKLVMKKNYRMLSGLRAFVFQNLVSILDGKTGRTDGVMIPLKDEKPAEVPPES